MKKKKRKIFFVIFVVVLIFVLNLKNIGKSIYPIKYNDYIIEYSNKYDLDPYLVVAIIKVESNFEKNAVSSKDARGLMQLTPSTAEWAAEKIKIDNFSVDMLFDPEINIKMGCWYLDDLRREFGSNMELVLAAYNGGRGNVKKWLNNYENSRNGTELDYIPFKETDEYVKKVQVNYNIYKLLYGKDEDYSGSIKEILLKYFS